MSAANTDEIITVRQANATMTKQQLPNFVASRARVQVANTCP